MKPFPQHDDLELRDLVGRACRGETEAVGGLYDRYADRIYRFALTRLGDPDAAEDLLHEVFVKVIEALPRYEERGLPFGAWLFRIARNSVVDRVRATAPGASLDAALALADEAPGPAALAELGSDAALLRAAIGRLTPEQRDVVLYRFFGGLTPGEIAELMSRREGTIRALQFRALGALRRHLEEAGVAPERIAAPAPAAVLERSAATRSGGDARAAGLGLRKVSES